LLEVTGKPIPTQSNGGKNESKLGAGYQPTSHPVEETFPEDTTLNKRTPPVFLNVPKENKTYQTRPPVITGEVHYKGILPIDGVLVGQPGSNGGSLGVRQKSGSVFAAQPELSGEIDFRDMLRVNGHIAGTVYSKKGTLIVDTFAMVEANVDVAVAVIGGTVRGDIVAHEKIELGPRAKIYGNIWTRSISIKDGAVFDGVCTMIGGCVASD
jgi:cytoskeletal protein CcmA (bactofilin family)